MPETNPQVIKNILDLAKKACLKFTKKYDLYIEPEIHAKMQ